MATQRNASTSRDRLDERFAKIGEIQRFTPPVRGWIRAIREALGMSSVQFAHRMGIKQPTALGIEQSEAKGNIQLDTLRRAAEALDCALVYMLVPNKPLRSIVHERARDIVMKQLAPIEHSMALENQRVKISARLVDDLIRDLEPRRLWDGE
jgi:predicted DNA-binding mobile mystery protein A